MTRFFRADKTEEFELNRLRKTSIVAIAAVVAAGFVTAQAQAIPSAPPVKTDFTEREIDSKRLVARTAHAISVKDAFALADTVDAKLIGLRFEQPHIEGEYYPSPGYAPGSFLRDFDSDFGTVPEIRALVFSADDLDETSAGSIAADLAASSERLPRVDAARQHMAPTARLLLAVETFHPRLEEAQGSTRWPQSPGVLTTLKSSLFRTM